jgi:type IV secretory pathway protease TraF
VADLGGREIIKRVSEVSPSGFYLLGDNLAHSSDSRSYGWFGRGTIKGIIIGSIRR